MITDIPDLSPGKKVYFASDFHLGVPDKKSSREREKKIVRWLEKAEKDAEAIFILGDIFDFWFEYKYTIPKGFIRVQGKLALLKDKGIPVYFFTGNHDMWMFDYFPQELDIPVIRKPQSINLNGVKFLIGHGDGLGPGDHTYKLLKRVFANKICQIAFAILPPFFGMGIANLWSRKSRISNVKKDAQFLGENEWLWQYSVSEEKKEHHTYYIFGHRHLPLEMKVAENSTYFNLGEWVNYFTYGVFDGQKFSLEKFE